MGVHGQRQHLERPAHLRRQRRRDGSTTWPNAKSNSVIVHQPLQFQVTVNNPATSNPVTNTANLRNTAVPGSPGTDSNTVQTLIGASIGDFVWADLDGGGDQDTGEPGISGVEVCASPCQGGREGGATPPTARAPIASPA